MEYVSESQGTKHLLPELQAVCEMAFYEDYMIVATVSARVLA